MGPYIRRNEKITTTDKPAVRANAIHIEAPGSSRKSLPFADGALPVFSN
jgi:hypothetical protein